MIYTVGSTPIGGILLSGILSVFPGSCTHEIPVTVTITASEEGWEIRYTTDGSEPTLSSTLYEELMGFTEDVTVKAKAFKGAQATETVTAVYELVPGLAITPDGGVHETWVQAALSCSDPDYALHLTTDGTIPDANSPVYAGPWWVSGDVTVQAVGIRASDGRHTFIKAVAIDLSLASVTVEPGAGDYYYRYPSDAPEIVLTCNREGHSLYYSLDGSDPTFVGEEYTEPLPRFKSGTLKAIARKDGIPASALRAVAYAMRTMLTAATELAWGESGEMLAHQTGMPWSPAMGLDARYGFHWGLTGKADAAHSIRWLMAREADTRMGLDWSGTRHADFSSYMPWWPVDKADARHRLEWSETGRADAEIKIPWARAGRVDVGVMLRWSEAKKIDFATSLPWGLARAVDIKTEIPWTQTRAVDVTHYTPFLPGQTEPVKQKLIKQIGIPWMAVARLIMTQQEIKFTRVDTGEKVAILSGTFGLDDHSYSYSFSGVVPSRAELDKIRPGENPVEVELSVNGYVGRFVVTGYSENREWGSGTYSITGVSPAVVLGAPYCPQQTRTFTGVTAQQVVAQALDGSGWSFEWQLLENPWNINGELSVVDATRIEIIDAIVKACGGMIQADPLEKKLWLKPRHKVSPWNYDTATVDETLMQGILGVSEQHQARPGYNQVIVSGVQTGEIDTVRREGTAGDSPAPDIAEALLNNQAVCIERGRTELADNGPDVTSYTLELPLPNKGSGQRPKMLFPGEILAVNDKGMWRGRVAATEIGFVPGQTRQRTTVERYHV